MTAKHPPNVQNYIKTPSEVAKEQVDVILTQLCDNCQHPLRSHGPVGCETVIGEGCSCGFCEEMPDKACSCEGFLYPSSPDVETPEPDRDEAKYYLSGHIYFKKATYPAYNNLISALPKHLEDFNIYIVPWSAEEEDNPCEYTERLMSRDRTEQLEAVHHLKTCNNCREHVERILQFTSTEIGIDFKWITKSAP